MAWIDRKMLFKLKIGRKKTKHTHKTKHEFNKNKNNEAQTWWANGNARMEKMYILIYIEIKIDLIYFPFSVFMIVCAVCSVHCAVCVLANVFHTLISFNGDGSRLVANGELSAGHLFCPFAFFSNLLFVAAARGLQPFLILIRCFISHFYYYYLLAHITIINERI